MRNTPLTTAIQKTVDIKLAAVDKLMQDLVEPLEKLGSPEELIGKQYEYWTTQDLEILKRIYGGNDNTPLSNLIFKKSFERVKELESEEL